MSLELMDEHERGERVRAWLRQNGSSIVTGVTIGLALIFGWQWWQRNQVEQRLTAATQYQALNDAIERKETDAVSAISEELVKSHPKSPYTVLALLNLADTRLSAGDVEGADKALERAAATTSEPALLGLANLRRARVALAKKDGEAALKHLDVVPADLYAGLAAEVRGDALRTLERNDDARAAYKSALTLLDTGAPNRRIVEMKLADLGGGKEDVGADKKPEA